MPWASRCAAVCMTCQIAHLTHGQLLSLHMRSSSLQALHTPSVSATAVPLSSGLHGKDLGPAAVKRVIEPCLTWVIIWGCQPWMLCLQWSAVVGRWYRSSITILLPSQQSTSPLLSQSEIAFMLASSIAGNCMRREAERACCDNLHPTCAPPSLQAAGCRLQAAGCRLQAAGGVSGATRGKNISVDLLMVPPVLRSMGRC
jgi:hypothetical protein